ncbi:hypothetical protein DMA12_26435 [Amycolatopsis balhimycina DSM 5908]|uniref:Uncharacterized protein n=1 Tax=Amycolatopsis balhimycina DSM 5908 TaxID=1081091 RepID=A0A428WCQ6_AMYBA|nr:hypothetical protein [Amycolatopsis balhimycina]RSM40757.1 hypothetical protein DMA12_26435 [Amycolatopsis balhimycina DSM 5908]
MRGVGVFLLVAGVVGSLVLRFSPEPLSVLDFLPLPVIFLGGYLYFRGGQHAALHLSRQPHSGGDFVLYLRAFSTDPTALGSTFRSMFWAGLATMSTDVECMATALLPFGRLHVIGRPGEGLPRPGGKTVYSGDEAWKQVVQEMLLTARLVVVRPAANPGVLWELARAREIVPADRLLIEVRGLSSRRYRETVQAMAKFGFTMPERRPRRGGFIRFSPTWQPELLPLSGPLVRRGLVNVYRRMAVFALRPVFDHHGVSWTRPSVSAGSVASLAVMGLIGLVIVIGFVVGVFFS